MNRDHERILHPANQAYAMLRLHVMRGKNWDFKKQPNKRKRQDIP